MKTIPTLLAEIPELAIEVQMTAGIGAPNPGLKSAGGGRPAPGSRPPTDLQVIDLLRADPLEDLVIGARDAHGNPLPAGSHLLDRLGLCVRMVAEERSVAGLSAPEPSYEGFSGRCGYLASTASWWLAERGLSEDISDEVIKIHRALEQADRVVREPTYRCRRCGNRLIPQPGGIWMRCEGCFHQEPGQAAIRDKIRKHKPMTAGAMEREWGDSLGLSAKRISQWKARGLIKPVGEVRINHIPCPIYEPWEVLRVHWRHAGYDDLAESG